MRFTGFGMSRPCMVTLGVFCCRRMGCMVTLGVFCCRRTGCIWRGLAVHGHAWCVLLQENGLHLTWPCSAWSRLVCFVAGERVASDVALQCMVTLGVFCCRRAGCIWRGLAVHGHAWCVLLQESGLHLTWPCSAWSRLVCFVAGERVASDVALQCMVTLGVFCCRRTGCIWRGLAVHGHAWCVLLQENGLHLTWPCSAWSRLVCFVAGERVASDVALQCMVTLGVFCCRRTGCIWRGLAVHGHAWCVLLQENGLHLTWPCSAWSRLVCFVAGERVASDVALQCMVTLGVFCCRRAGCIWRGLAVHGHAWCVLLQESGLHLTWPCSAWSRLVCFVAGERVASDVALQCMVTLGVFCCRRTGCIWRGLAVHGHAWCVLLQENGLHLTWPCSAWSRLVCFVAGERVASDVALQCMVTLGVFCCRRTGCIWRGLAVHGHAWCVLLQENGLHLTWPCSAWSRLVCFVAGERVASDVALQCMVTLGVFCCRRAGCIWRGLAVHGHAWCVLLQESGLHLTWPCSAGSRLVCFVAGERVASDVALQRMVTLGVFCCRRAGCIWRGLAVQGRADRGDAEGLPVCYARRQFSGCPQEARLQGGRQHHQRGRWVGACCVVSSDVTSQQRYNQSAVI